MDAERRQLSVALIQAIESSEAARVRGDARDVAASRAYCMLGFDFPLVTVSDLNSLESELASADAAAYARFPLSAKVISNICEGAAKTPVTAEVTAYQKLAGRLLVANLPALLQLPLAELDSALSKLPFDEAHGDAAAEQHQSDPVGAGAAQSRLEALSLGDVAATSPDTELPEVEAAGPSIIEAESADAGPGAGDYDSDDSDWEALEVGVPPSNWQSSSGPDADAEAAAASAAAAAAATPERRVSVRLRWLASSLVYGLVREQGVWESLDLSGAANDTIRACVAAESALAEVDTEFLQRQLVHLICERMIARPDSLARLSWTVGALRGDSEVVSGRFPSPQQEAHAGLLSRLCAHFSAPAGPGERAVNPSALGALWAQVSEALPGLFVPLAESVMEALTSKKVVPARVDLRSRAQQLGDVVSFFILNAPQGTVAGDELLRSGAVRVCVALFAAAGHAEGLSAFRRAVILAVAALPKVADFASHVPAFQERFRGEGFGPGGPGHAAGLVWPAVAPPPSRATATAAAAAAAAAAEARCLPDLVALLAAQPCEAVAIDALQLLVDIARARGAHGQPPLLQLQQPLVELQGKLRAALGAASARAGPDAVEETPELSRGEGEGAPAAAPSVFEGGDDDGKGLKTAAASGAGPGAEVEAEKVRVRAGLALKAVKELLLLVGGGARKSD